jgi:ribulose kinase
VLECVGGRVSLEMQLPKLLWLKRHHSTCWGRAGRFFDLPDWLTYRATGGGDVRSLCSTVCKWNYWIPCSSQVIGWDAEFFRAADLAELAGGDWAAIGGTAVQCPGQPVEVGLSSAAAAELGGLAPGTPVGTSLIDAHAGMLGMLAAAAGGPVQGRLGAIRQSANKKEI